MPRNYPTALVSAEDSSNSNRSMPRRIRETLLPSREFLELRFPSQRVSAVVDHVPLSTASLEVVGVLLALALSLIASKATLW